MSVKLTYLNINGLNKAKLNFIEQSIAQKDADIFIIAEHWFSEMIQLQKSIYFLQTSRLPECLRSHGHQNGGLAILANPKIHNSLSIISNDEFTISFKIGKITLTSVYLPPRLSDLAICNILGKCVNSDIILGDINCRFGKPSNDRVTWNITRGTKIVQQLESANFQRINADSTCSRNDHIFSKIPLSWEYRWLPPDLIKTDHGAMIIKVQETINPELSKPAKRFALNALNEPILFQALAEDFEISDCYRIQEIISMMEMRLLQLKFITPATLQSTVDVIDRLITTSITSICEIHLPSYDAEHIKSTKDDKLYDTNPDTTQGYLKSIKIFKRSQRLFNKQHPIRARNPAKSVTEEAYEFYSEIYQAPTPPKISLDPIDFKAPIPEETLNAETIKLCILKYDSTKACGPDGIHIKILKCLASRNSFSNLISQAFRFYYRANITPKSWNISRIHLLAKDLKEPFVDKTRPISLTQILRRIFEKSMHSKWSNTTWTQTHPNQAGFKRGYSTYSHILLADHLLRRRKRIAIFLDLKSAFDKVSHEKLIWILDQRGCPIRDKNIIFSLMLNATESIISCNHTQHETHLARTCGLFQGSILSPLLFNLYIDNLAKALNDTCPTLLFADDILLLADKTKEAQNCLAIAEAWSRDFEISFNAAKSGTMGTSEILKISGENIPPVSEYKYLGVPMTRNGVNWPKHIQTLHTKSKNLRLAIQERSIGWNSITKLTIYRCFVRPIIEYALPLVTNWSKVQPKETRKDISTLLDSQHKEALKWIFNTSYNHALLSSISGLGSMDFRISQLEASLAMHLCQLAPNNPITKSKHIFQFRTSNHDFFHLCFESELVTRYKNQSKYKWKTFIIKCKLTDPILLSSRLTTYVAPKCRTPTGVDRCLYEQDADNYILWRSNRCFLNTKCPGCKKPFNRGHITKCSLLSHESLQKTSLNPPTNKPHSYNLLDELLNRKKYDDFNTIFTKLKKSLHAATWNRTPDTDAFP